MELLDEFDRNFDSQSHYFGIETDEPDEEPDGVETLNRTILELKRSNFSCTACMVRFSQSHYFGIETLRF